jgi:S-adenosylmethionine hydrolase
LWILPTRFSRRTYRDFPAGTIFVAVVDPGVGSKRRAILAEAGGYYFIAPDNGLLSFITNDATVSVFEITNREFLAGTVSATFHGRDIFASVAAHLSRGAAPDRFGPLISDLQTIPAAWLEHISSSEIEGRIIHIDRFGNLVTNLAKDALPVDFTLEINGRTIDAHRQFYAEAEPGEAFSIWGSAGFLEISVRNGSAKEILGAGRGDKILVRM